MITPDYLREPSLEGHIYGKLTYDNESGMFHLSGEPLLLEYAKRIFPGARVTRGGGGHLEFHNTRREISDLNWLLMRFPVDVSQCAEMLSDARESAILQINRRMSGTDRRRTRPPSDFTGKLYPYQEVAVTFLNSNKRCILGDGMGCIDGEALVSLNRAGRGFKVKLKDAYTRFHGINTDGRDWDPDIVTMGRSLCDGELRLNQVVNILDKGVRPVVEMVLGSGKVLRLTPDHEVLTPNGDIEAINLRRGDVVYTNGRQICPTCGTDENIITYPYARFLGFCRECMYRKLREKPSWKGGKAVDQDGYVRCSGHQDHPRANLSGQVYEHILVMEQQTGRAISVKEMVHHRNGDRQDNRVENLEVLTVAEHHRRHARHLNLGSGENVCFVPVEDEVVSVEPCGEIHVYDMVMEDPYRNFVANGVVVHNCGKTWSGLGAAAQANEYPVLVVCQTHVQRQWQRMIGMLFDFPVKGAQGMTPFELATKRGEALAPILKGRTPYKIPDAPFVIIHYGLISWWEKDLLERQFRTVLFDEVQELRHTGTAKYSTASLVSGEASNVWGLSGTPTYGYGREIWSVMNAIDFHCLGSEEAFTREWCTGYGERIVADPKALNGHLVREGLLLRRRASDSDVAIDLPKVIRKVEDLHHDELLYEKLIGAARKSAERYGSANFFEKGEIARTVERESRMATGISKAKYVAEFVASLIESGERPLLYAWHHAVHDIYQGRLGQYKPAIFTGKQTVVQKEESLRRYMNGETDLAILSLRSAAGLDGLQHRATMCVFGELDWSPAVHCFDLKTEVLTKEGFRGVDEVAVGDEVAGFDVETGNIRWLPALGKVDRPLGPCEKMYRLKTVTLDILVTGDHRMVYRSNRRTNAGTRRSSWGVETAQNLSGVKRRYVPVCGNQEAPGVDLSADELRLIGLFVSDGNFDGRQVTIYQAINQPWNKDIVAILNGAGMQWRVNQVRDMNWYVIPTGSRRGILDPDRPLKGWRSISRYLDKDLSPLLENCTMEQLECFIHGLWLGDGTKKKWDSSVRRITNTNITMLERLQSLCVRRGYCANLSTRKNRTSAGRIVYDIHISRRQDAYLQDSPDRENRFSVDDSIIPGERVWCLNNELGTLVVRRNGKVCITGNSQCETRIARIGVDDSLVDVPSYYCVSSVGFDEAMLDVLGVKTGQFTGIMGDEPESLEDQRLAEERATGRIKMLVDKLNDERTGVWKKRDKRDSIDGGAKRLVRNDNRGKLIGAFSGKLGHG